MTSEFKKLVHQDKIRNANVEFKLLKGYKLFTEPVIGCDGDILMAVYIVSLIAFDRALSQNKWHLVSESTYKKHFC